MPSRNSVPNAAELVSRSLKWTSPLSPARSAMVNASNSTGYAAGLNCRAYDEQIIARVGRRVQSERVIWFPAPRPSGAAALLRGRTRNPEPHPPLDSGFARRRAPRYDGRERKKKEPRFPAAFEVDNREASNRVDRSHSVSKQGRSSNSGKSLIDRKRTVLLKRR